MMDINYSLRENLHTRRKRERIHEIKELCKEKQGLDGDNFINEKELVAKICLKYACSRRYIKEIIDDLVLNKELARQNGGICFIR